MFRPVTFIGRRWTSDVVVRLQRERETRAMELAKQRELRKLEIEAQLNSEVRKVDSAIQLARAGERNLAPAFESVSLRTSGALVYFRAIRVSTS